MLGRPVSCASATARRRAEARCDARLDDSRHDRSLVRRRVLLGTFVGVSLAGCPVGALSLSSAKDDPHIRAISDVEELAGSALNAYNAKDLDRAYTLYTQLVTSYPDDPVWIERRGQVQVDRKQFEEAITDFNAAERKYKETVDAKYYSLGLLSNRALAYEGLYDWNAAIADYDLALRLSAQVGYAVPYVLNSRGNCHASLASQGETDGVAVPHGTQREWERANEDYQAAARAFQRARNLPGAIFAASNAALVAAQLGDDNKALKDLKATARRAPGSIDMRAAIAAIYWAAGNEAAAEEYWNWACEKINSGQLVDGGPVLDSCEKYRDADWLARIRRWPPVMVTRMGDFLSLRPSTAPAVLLRA